MKGDAVSIEQLILMFPGMQTYIYIHIYTTHTHKYHNYDCEFERDKTGVWEGLADRKGRGK